MVSEVTGQRKKVEGSKIDHCLTFLVEPVSSEWEPARPAIGAHMFGPDGLLDPMG